MKIIDINTWKRKQHYEHFSALSDPYFAVTVPFDVTKAFAFSKSNKVSFFGKYLHDCMKAINAIENFKYRIVNEQVVAYDIIHASPTIMRSDKTFGFSFVEFNNDIDFFIKNIEKEKRRIESSQDLYPPKNSLDCIHCSAMPWLNFTAQKEPVSNTIDSVPKLSFSKAVKQNELLQMNVSIAANHALMDGYHVSLFAEKFQENLNK